jgi:long-chain acyl-CoA synthetase
VIVRLALGAAGALPVPFDDLLREAELGAALADCQCRRVFTSAAHVPALRSIGGDRLDLVVIDDDAPAMEGARRLADLADDGTGRLPDLRPDMAAMLVYTSGTTGPPKSFVLSHANLWANIRVLARERLIGPGDLVLLPLPLHHVYPFVVGLLTSLESGAAVVIAEAVAGPEIVQAFRVPGVTVIVGVPRLYAAILDGIQARISQAGPVAAVAFRGALRLAARLRRRFGVDIGRWLFRGLRARFAADLRLLVSGGARIEPEVLWPLVGLGFEVRSGYGLAETASIFTGNLPGREHLGSEGLPFQGGALRIAEPNEEGVGEIQVRGPSVFAGYRGRPAVGRDAFTSDGWFRSGDLGRLDADGYLYVTGRTKELLVLGGGKKINPEELEKIYGDSPAIREIAVLEHGGAPVALVMPDIVAIQAGGEQRIDDVVRVSLATKSQSLPSYMRISGFALIREPLPRTRLGKYRRFLLPAIYERARQGVVRPRQSEPSPADLELLARPLSQRIWQILEERYPREAIALDTNLQLDLGVDSLEWLALLLALEQKIGLRLSDRDAALVETVRDLIVLAEGRAGRSVDLKGGPAEAAADMRWIAPVGIALTLLGVTLYWLNRVLMRVFFRLRAEGLEHVPSTGAVVLVANHASDLDPLALAASLSLRQMRRIYWGGAANRLLARRWSRPLWRALHVVPVDERLPASSLALAGAVLTRGDCLVWFPEMWRSPDGELQRFLPGIGKLIAESGAPAVPVFIAGTFDAMPRGRRLPRLAPVGIWIAEPLDRAALSRDADGTPLSIHITSRLRQAIVALSEKARWRCGAPQGGADGT